MKTSIKWVFMLAVATMFAITACSQENKAKETVVDKEVVEENAVDEAALLDKENPVGTYGEALSDAETFELASFYDQMESYEGQKVKIKGMIDESCPKRGCWVNIVDGGKELKVKVTDGEIVFPLSSQGHEGVFEGVLERFDMDLEQTRKYLAHEAEETGKEFDPESITEPMHLWRLKSKAARID